MKILFLANSENGLYRFRREVIEKLISLDHEVFISVPSGQYDEKLKKMGCQLIETSVDSRGLNPFADLRLYFKYHKILRGIQPNVVLRYTIKPNIYGGIACHKLHIPCIANVTGLGTSIENGGLLSRIALALYHQGLKSAKRVFFQNTANQQFFIRKKIVQEG